LKQTQFNWFALEEAISQKFPLLPKDTINQSLSTIRKQLPWLRGLSKEDKSLDLYLIQFATKAIQSGQFCGLYSDL
jgi:hypothetical protein